MAETDRITINIKTHGQYQTDAHHLDLLMAEYLPASVKDLRKLIAEEAGVGGCQGHCDEDAALMSVGIGEAIYCDGTCANHPYHDLQTITECLMILAELRGYATN
ncbi:hypothetical protein [Streptomyces sp. NBC_01198]|uniref:hypothetical protein n=1 Tax=Streptomyces sp. NBC_01198 TaxID=2903769 RepID=UPI002E0FFB53|nr:hypothetical protein OG702_32120 [Streptomyces sp. NBC_01198]